MGEAVTSVATLKAVLHGLERKLDTKEMLRRDKDTRLRRLLKEGQTHAHSIDAQRTRK